MINTRKRFEKLKIKATYTSFMHQKIKQYGLDFRTEYKKNEKDRKVIVFFLNKEDWNKILEGLRVS